MEFVCKVVHDATQTLSDHHPLLIRFAMQPPHRSSLRKSSYFKLDLNELLVESTKIELKSIWCEQVVGNRDPRINRELG